MPEIGPITHGRRAHAPGLGKLCRLHPTLVTQSLRSRRNMCFVFHFAAYSGSCTLQHIFSVLSKPTGITQEGANNCCFFFPFFLFFEFNTLTPHLLLRCLPPFLISRRVQPSLPSSTTTSTFIKSRSFSAFYFLLLSIASYARESEKSPLSPRFELVNWLLY